MLGISLSKYHLLKVWESNGRASQTVGLLNHSLLAQCTWTFFRLQLPSHSHPAIQNILFLTELRKNTLACDSELFMASIFCSFSYLIGCFLRLILKTSSRMTTQLDISSLGPSKVLAPDSLLYSVVTCMLGCPYIWVQVDWVSFS